MSRLLAVTVLLAALASASAACSGGKDEDESDAGASPFVTPTANPNLPQFSQDAQVTYPRLIDLQTKVFSQTCSPNPNVCHNSSNYPQLATAGATLAIANSPCNVEIPDRTQGWDNCERAGDHLRAGLDINTRVAWMERMGPTTWRVGMEHPSPVTGDRKPEIYAEDGETILNPPDDWGVSIALVAGTSYGVVTVEPIGDNDFIPDFVDAVLATVVGGDPNGNGTWGADEATIEPGAVVVPGSLERSYLWGRITGTVPGFRMPLANTPITNPGYVAIACWIEGLSPTGGGDPDDLIDYDTCDYAQAPQDYATTE